MNSPIGRQRSKAAHAALRTLACAAALLAGTAASASATAAEAVAEASAPASPLRLSLGFEQSVHPADGSTGSQRALYRLQWEPLLAKDVLLRADLKGKVFFGDDHQSRARGDSVSGDLRCRECFVQANFGGISLKAGYQVLVWSEMNSLSGIDITNRFDMAEFVYISRDDSRMGEAMLVAERYSDQGTLTAFIKPDARPNKEPPPGSKYQLTRFDPRIFAVSDQKPEPTEAGLRWLMQRENSDLALTAAHVVDNDPVYNLNTAALLGHQGHQGHQGDRGDRGDRVDRVDRVDSGDGRIPLAKSYRGYGLYAISGNYGLNRFTLKGELVWAQGRSFQHQPTPEALTLNQGTSRRNTLKTVLAMEYTSIDSYFFALEFANTHMLQCQPFILQERNLQEMFVLASKRYLNDKLALQYTYYRNFNDRFAFHEFKGNYGWTDNLSLGFLYHRFSLKDAAQFPIRNPDRFTLNATYTF